MRISVSCGLALLCLSGMAWAQTPGTAPDSSLQVVPGLSYGAVPDLPLPKTIMFSVSPDQIIADAEEWSRRGINAFFVDYIAREWSNDIWAADGKPWTIGESDEMFQKTRKAADICKRIGSDTFLKISFDHPFEWFNDTAWQHILHNFRQFAIFARDTGCTGLAMDIEYIGDQYDFDWPGYTYEGYTREDLAKTIRNRMTKVMQALYDEFPDMVFATFPEQGFCLGALVHTAWIEEAARRNAPGGIHYSIESTYRSPNINYMFGRAWVCNEVLQRQLSAKGRRYWNEKCSIAEGVWPFGFNYQTIHEPGLSLDEFRQGYAASLMASRRYNWIYAHNCIEQLIGRNLDDQTGGIDLKPYLQIMADKSLATDAKYVALAKQLRAMNTDNLGLVLGLTPTVQLMGPTDTPVVELVPNAQADPVNAGKMWQLAQQFLAGKEVDFHRHFGTQTHWMLLGPFPNDDPFVGHAAVYPPETEINLAAEYDGVGGKVRWQEYRQENSLASVDLTKVFTPTEHVCAYALCYVASPTEQMVQLRVGTNDAGKVWLGKTLVYDYPREGGIALDRAILPATLPKGTTPVLIKVSNRQLKWGFVFRITDPQGNPVPGLSLSAQPSP